MEPAASYRERLLPSPITVVFLLALLVVFSVAIGAPFGARAGWMLFVVGGLVAGAVLFWAAPTVAVSREALMVAGATLPRSAVAQVTTLDGPGTREARGPGSDARTYVMLVTWATSKAVLVRIDDPADPHPAWLFSSRHPERVAAALQLTAPSTSE